MSQNKIIIILLVIILGLGAFLLIREPKTVVEEPTVENTEVVATSTGKLNGNPTNFSKSGTIVFKENTEVGQQVPYFTYLDSEGKATTTELVFDPLSFCVTNTGGIACVAMSVTFDVPFNNKKAVVEGVTLSENNQILVRKLYILQTGEQARYPEPGQTFVTWEQGVNLIRVCSVKGVMQTHNLDIYITMKDGTIIRTVEPVIDEVFKIVNEATPSCGTIGIGTE